MISRPTIATLFICLGVFALQTLVGVVGIGVEVFALSLPLGHRPWTLATSVYAHGGLTHLLVNVVALLLVGPPVAYVTTAFRFHAFFLTTGAIAGIVQVLVAVPFGGGSVLGASGAIFALLGYVLVGNRGTERLVSWLPFDRRGRVLFFGLLAVVLTAVTAAPNVALIAHFVGFCLGVGTARVRLLHVRPRSEGRPRQNSKGR